MYLIHTHTPHSMFHLEYNKPNLQQNNHELKTKT